MQAVVNLAGGGDSDVPIPPELRLYWACQRFGGLPDAGAVFDQDAGLLSRMSILANIYDAVQRYRGLSGDDIHKMRPEDGRLLAWLEGVGVRV